MTKEWLKYRTTILGLYKDQSKTLDEVRRIMKEEYGFEASVRAYRSRFDKWRVHKYNCARRRAATVTAAGGYQQQGGYLRGNRDGHVQRPHAECQFLPVGRHYSAPDVLVTESDVRPYTPQGSYTRSGIKSEPHVDSETSPRVLTVGGDFPGQAYRPWYESHSENIADSTHQAPKAMGVASSPTRMLLNSGLPVRSDNSLYHNTEQLHWIMHAIQLPLQQHALESLRQCLLCSPDVTRALPSGETPFSQLANMFWQQLASDGTLGPDPVWKLACECLRHCLVLGADPDVLVGDRPFLFRILEQPARTRAFGLLWPFVWRLAFEASPVSNNHGFNALHSLLLLPPGDETAAPAPAPTTTEASARAHLTKLLIGRVAAAGRLADRNAAGLTALQQYVYHAAARDPPEHVLAICAELVRHEGQAAAAGGGDTSAVVPLSFVGELRAGKLPPGLQAHDAGGGGGVSAAASFLPFVWTSACQQSLNGDAAAAEDHLDVVLLCAGGRVDAEGLRALLPRPAVVPVALPSPVSPRGEIKYAW
ncbi:hypothetical protein INS49_009762 [Diaporthe citri]|uniref:uncharacterized protein n=1 Tax=Diaporthe citri TaxID=83186 RepID=UPI001C803048|nr:uncharacterized protein INS49_009762 [Diaporthe citri]KAG6361535.1 hypothetical protein INS49_009762 [Diaporthe citri]